MATETPSSGGGGGVVLACRGLGKHYAGRRALAGLDLVLRAGEGLALVGPNGAGKSTALQLAAGVLYPSEGEVLVYGQDPAVHHVVRASIGFLGHEGFLEPDEAVCAQVAFAHAMRGGRGPTPAEVCRAFELEDVWEADAGSLSRGFTRRAELAAVLSGGPTLLLLDEPLGGLDAARQRAFPGLLRRLVPGAAILVATHALAALTALTPEYMELTEGVCGPRRRTEPPAPTFVGSEPLPGPTGVS